MASGDRLIAGSAIAAATAAIALWANRQESSDIYFLLAGGRFVAEHGFPQGEVFSTLNAGGSWEFQQWLAALAFYGLDRLGGMPVVDLGYALLLGAAMVPLVWGCRNRRPGDVLAAWLLLAPTLIAVFDPRAEGFSLLAFSLCVVLVADERRGRRIWLLPPLFLVWANVHAAFAAGMLLVALVTAGGAIDHRRGLWGRAGFGRRFTVLALLLPAVLGTPLGRGVLHYMSVLATDPLLPVFTFEWQPTTAHPLLVAYVALVAAYAGRLWWRSPRPRRIEPLLVAAGFCLLALTAVREIVWLGPIAFYLLRELGPVGSIGRAPQRTTAAVLGAAAAALALWFVAAAPRPAEAALLTDLGDVVAAHPPASGRVLTTTGLGSYLLWRAPGVPITVDGRLENYPAADVETTYGVLRGDRASMSALDRWDVTGVVTGDRRALAPLAARGFVIVARGRDGGWYLVRQSVGASGTIASSSARMRRSSSIDPAPDRPTAMPARKEPTGAAGRATP